MVSGRHGSLSSSCLSLVGLTMEKLKALGLYEDNANVTILVNRKKAIPEGIDPGKLVLVGDCLKMHGGKGIFVEGCPPGEPSPHWAIVDRRFPIFDLRDPGPGQPSDSGGQMRPYALWSTFADSKLYGIMSRPAKSRKDEILYNIILNPSPYYRRTTFNLGGKGNGFF